MSVSQRYSVISCQYGRQGIDETTEECDKINTNYVLHSKLSGLCVQQQFIIATRANYTSLYQETCCFQISTSGQTLAFYAPLSCPSRQASALKVGGR